MIYAYFNYIIFSDRKIDVTHPKVKRRIFNEKNEHFFGYYDKTPWNQDQKKILYHRVNDNMIDLDIVVHNFESDESRCLATTKTWNWQQGAMLQWLPPDSKQIVYNNISRDKNIIAEIRNVNTGELIDILPMPIQTLRKDGKKAVSLNYRRLAILRPDYGYCCDAVNFTPDMPDDKDGIFSIDMQTKDTRLILSIEYLKKMYNFPRLSYPRHKVNHAMYSPSGNHFVFLHRCLHSKGKKDRLYFIRDDGTDLRLLLDDDMVSHYSWTNDRQLIVYARTKINGDGYYLVDTNSDEVTPIANELWHFGDGHPSMGSNETFFITDSYPDRTRMQHLFFYDTQKKYYEEITRLYAAVRFNGEKRCDFHPRLSPDNRFISIDSIEKGKRIMSIFDISKFLEGRDSSMITVAIP
jgi:Tol biopolymer transport system component